MYLWSGYLYELLKMEMYNVIKDFSEYLVPTSDTQVCLSKWGNNIDKKA